jgi:hypothetical protein
MRFYRKHKKLIKALLLLSLPFILYGLLKLAIWYSTKNNIEKFSSQYAGFVQLKYQTISSSIKGNVSVNGLTLFIPMINESIHIKRIRLTTDNILTLLSLTSKLESQEIPKSLGLLIEGVKIDINSQLFNSSQESVQTPAERFNTLACGNIQRFDEKALKQMGYDNISTDINLNYSYDPIARTLQLNLYENIEQFFSLDLNAQINNLSKIPNTQEVAMSLASSQNMPQLGKVKLTIEDDSFTTRKVNFCAKNNKSDQKTYISKHVKMADNFLQQMGIKLHQSLLDAYHKSMSHPGNIILSMDFSDTTNIMELSEFALNDIISQLGTEILINNKTISPISIQFNQQRFSKATTGKSPEIKIHDPNVKIKTIKKYHFVNKNNLKKYQRYPVIIKTIQGKTLKGELSIADKKKFEVITRTHGGKLGYFVGKAEIKSVQVYY